ncbi:serine threonine- phosphatase 2A regulatory subunit B subunit beta-like isoform X1 [Labeo rohita]|uniref:Serine threonine-phosphatase 2A regulatory subunit B subunit beta-like isoform X1 n=1 Tax=Labeo rohita TaxID=84645 RepID=A0A498NCU7_LABRO|nr:serine threonine- phosphatase 2A regulatory subunit B subunit beta-like isoform X1 [Labeo rohita]
MKVDELFLFWLSEPSTQAMLKDYLNKIKNGEEIDLSHADFKGTSTLVLTENNNNNIASKINATERMTAALGAPCSPPSATLPSASGSNNRAGVNARALRRSVSTKKQAQAKKEEPVIPALSESIPKFYFPRGQPQANINIDNLISKIEKIFSQFPDERVTLKDMGLVAKACECPLYWKAPLFHAAGGDRRGYVSVHKFVAMWRKVLQTCHDDASKFLHLLAKPGCNYLEQEDFIPFLQNVALLEEEEEINQLTEFFSYEHFYVIYCKFWELDTDHDLYIDQRDLIRHNDQDFMSAVVNYTLMLRDRKVHKEGRLSYADFVWFLISEEDKKTETSIEYWFRCMDLDGDGVLSMYELQYFYQEQCQKLEAMAIEPLPFEDCLCQMLDMDAETMGQEISDWERYAAEEYDNLVAEETANEQYNDGYDNVLDPVDHITCAFDLRNEKRRLFEIPNPHCNLDLDEYEYEDDFE